MLIIFYILLLLPFNVSASELWQVQSPFSSTHTENMPSTINSISVEWSAPSGLTPSSTEGYYVSFSSPLAYTFTESDTESITRGVGEILKLNKSSVSTTSLDVIGETLSGTGVEPYYFNIAVLDDMEVPFVPGITTHLGPYFIDTESPKFPTVSAPQTTSRSNNIPLTLGASGASLMCISESGYGICGESEWNDYTTSWYWSVSDGEGVKNIYVQFKDVAGNTANSFTSILFEREVTFSGDVVAYAIPTLSEWGLMVFMMLLLIVGVFHGNWQKHICKRKIRLSDGKTMRRH
ncbi:MAG: hypothetical protein OMM_01813 [Candidatus Magnetoglobus multicellularis str. Araruama]|uniref:IPTL-CTERM protein sorting domain-containing protein n=1 Tax=Candidatus Magnetoglobus multicellularis str. Araruama TaxID=890399 RepID=A0A1V1PBY4_9BACT|nr:MAG: hypothetical protein OMM_01813 [Candidatus Magnetoglobus multicellularis str. Araruama]